MIVSFNIIAMFQYKRKQIPTQSQIITQVRSYQAIDSFPYKILLYMDEQVCDPRSKACITWYVEDMILHESSPRYSSVSALKFPSFV